MISTLLNSLKKAFKFYCYLLGGATLLLGLIVWVTSETTPALSPKTVLTIDFSTPVFEGRPADFLSSLSFEDNPTFNDVLQALDKAAQDPDVIALYARTDDTNLSFAQIQELRGAIKKFRQSGKKAYAYASSFGQMSGGLRPYYLASAFDEIWLQPSGDAGLTGMAIDASFYKDALEKLGIEAEFSARYEYKTGAASFTENRMSAPDRENTQNLMENLFEQISADIAADRNIDAQTMRQILLTGPYFAQDALNAKLVDRVEYADVLQDALEEQSEDAVNIADYIAVRAEKPQDRVAQITLSGVLTQSDDRFGGDASTSLIGVSQTIDLLHETADDDAVKGIVLRLDSPGGAYTPSDALWHEIIKIREKYGKPVVCSMGATAASGGYFLSLACDKVYAMPATITGSVGVFGGKFNAGKLLKKLGVNTETVAIGENADFFALHRGMTPSQRKFFEASLDRVYEDFTQKTAQRRNLTKEQIDKAARGRVFTGAQALDAGLIDAIGTSDDARKEVLRLANIDADLPLVEYPAQQSRWELLGEFLSSGTIRSDKMPLAARILLKLQTLSNVFGADNRLLFMP